MQLMASDDLKMVKQVTKSFMFDPIEEIGIQIDSKNPEDEEELRSVNCQIDQGECRENS